MQIASTACFVLLASSFTSLGSDDSIFSGRLPNGTELSRVRVVGEGIVNAYTSDSSGNEELYMVLDIAQKRIVNRGLFSRTESEERNLNALRQNLRGERRISHQLIFTDIEIIFEGVNATSPAETLPIATSLETDFFGELQYNPSIRLETGEYRLRLILSSFADVYAIRLLHGDDLLIHAGQRYRYETANAEQATRHERRQESQNTAGNLSPHPGEAVEANIRLEPGTQELLLLVHDASGRSLRSRIRIEALPPSTPSTGRTNDLR